MCNCEKRLFASSCLSVRKEHFDSHCTDFHEIRHLLIFLKYAEKIKGTLQPDSTDGAVRGQQQCTVLLIISRSFLLRMRNFSEENCTENQNARFTFNIFFSSENVAIYEIMRHGMVDQTERRSLNTRRHSQLSNSGKFDKKPCNKIVLLASTLSLHVLFLFIFVLPLLLRHHHHHHLPVSLIILFHSASFLFSIPLIPVLSGLLHFRCLSPFPNANIKLNVSLNAMARASRLNF